MKITTHSVLKTLGLGRRIARQIRPGDIICLFGELGSGKTVLTKGIAQGLGFEKKEIISPSFVLLREHKKGKIPLYHFDLYRLKKLTDILALGYEEYLFGDGVTVIEWAERLKSLMPKEYLKVSLSATNKNQRQILLTPIGTRYKLLLKGLE